MQLVLEFLTHHRFQSKVKTGVLHFHFKTKYASFSLDMRGNFILLQSKIQYLLYYYIGRTIRVAHTVDYL